MTTNAITTTPSTNATARAHPSWTADIAAPATDEHHDKHRMIIVTPWVDQIIDRRGFDPRHIYVETYWLGVIGPTATWIMRRFAESFDHSPDGFTIAVDALAGSIGVSAAKGPSSPFDRALGRCLRFGLARPSPTAGRAESDDLVLEVRRRLPQLPTRSLHRLPDHLARTHQDWVAEHQRRRSERGVVSAGMR